VVKLTKQSISGLKGEKMKNMFNKVRIATEYKRIKTETKKKRKMTD